jgi:transcriptional regulator
MKTYKERRRELRAEMILDIMVLRKKGMTMEHIGHKLGVTRGAINNLLKGYEIVDNPDT